MLELVLPDKTILGQIVYPNEKFVFNSTQNGEYKLCVSLTEGVYTAVNDQLQ